MKMLVIAAWAASLAAVQSTPPPSKPAPAAGSKKIPIVSVSGCLRQGSGDVWTLANATDPVPSAANAPPAADVPKTPPVGKLQFRLIGISEFNLPAHKDHAVVIKGLLIEATPMSRVNVTSVTDIAPNCPAAR